MTAPGHFGVYVHVPFCQHVCPYCDFAVLEADPLEREQEERYVDALLRELERRATAFAGRALASIYFGGGTPSLFAPASIARIRTALLEHFRERADPGAEIEITLEVNPSTTERERLPAFREQARVNRLSIGVQSFDDALLRKLGRAHGADECHATLAAARGAGFDDISLDLIFAALDETPETLERDLDAVIAFGPEHVSTYELVLEPGTPFGRAHAEGKLERYPADACADMVERIEARLGGAGYRRYELLNYSRPGCEAVHNALYWARVPILGLGVGAHSFDPPSESAPRGERLANPRGLEAWRVRVDAGEPVAESREVLSEAEARAETVFLSLRRPEGVSAAAFEAEFGAPPRAFYRSSIEALTTQGLLAEGEEGDLALTARGRLLADSVAEHFV
jgi:oxygen-independent coproporphyrinogen-3 oxidase